MELFLHERKTYPEISTPEQLSTLYSQKKLFGFHNVREEVYHSGPGLSSSVIKAYLESPAHAKMVIDRRQVTTDAMKFGSAVHAALFEPERFKKDYRAGPDCDRRTVAGKQLWNAFCSANVGTKILAADEVIAIDGIIRSLRTHDYYQYFEKRIGYPELAYYWEMGGFFCKCKYDWITTTGIPLRGDERRIIFDLKTTSYGVTPRECKSTIQRFGYDIQAAWYLSAVPDAEWVFIFAGKEPPYPITFYQLGPRERADAQDRLEGLLNIHRRCNESRSWPAHSNDIYVGD